IVAERDWQNRRRLSGFLETLQQSVAWRQELSGAAARPLDENLQSLPMLHQFGNSGPKLGVVLPPHSALDKEGLGLFKQPSKNRDTGKLLSSGDVGDCYSKIWLVEEQIGAEKKIHVTAMARREHQQRSFRHPGHR